MKIKEWMEHVKAWLMDIDKKVWKIVLIAAILVFIISAGFSAYYIYSVIQDQKAYEALLAQMQGPSLEEVMAQDFTSRDGDSPQIPEEVYLKDRKQELMELGLDVSNPIDFEELADINTDLYAWIRIPETNIDYPVAQHAEDDSFYLHHNMYKQAQFSGSIYSEAINSKDFNDPVTILYGHNMKNGSMFQNLHCFADQEFFQEHPYFYVYTKEGTLVYQVVYAGITDNKHIMYHYDFADESVYQQYLDDLYKVTSMSTHVREEVEVTTEDRLLIMSTCVGNNKNARYIVQAVRVYDGREEAQN